LNTIIRHVIIALRKKRNWTQIELAKRSRLSNVAISEIESGKKMPRLETLSKIASAFNIEVTELINYDISTLDIEESTDTTRLDSEKIAWCLKPENAPYIDFIYELSKDVPVDMLSSLLGTVKFFLNIKGNLNNGGTGNE
jgi:transcriptional regulator with XRE-family HTH domain